MIKSVTRVEVNGHHAKQEVRLEYCICVKLNIFISTVESVQCIKTCFSCTISPMAFLLILLHDFCGLSELNAEFPKPKMSTTL